MYESQEVLELQNNTTLWGGDKELAIISDAFNCMIILVTSNEATRSVNSVIFGTRYFSRIHLLRHKNHFMPFKDDEVAQAVIQRFD